jgi:hypothetical protein
MQSTEAPPVPQEQGEPQEPPRYVSVRDLSRLLKLSRQYLYRLAHQGILPSRIAGRKIDIYGAFYRDLKIQVDSCRSVDVVAFAKAWTAAHSPDVPEKAVA